MYTRQMLGAGMVLLVVACLAALSGVAWADDAKKPDQEGCVETAAGPTEAAPAAHAAHTGGQYLSPRAIVGKEAPDFEAAAFHEDAFEKVKLSDYAGQWVVLCFYPGDFTFV